MKIRAADAARAAHVIKQDFLASTGLSSEDLAAGEAVFSLAAETVVCPACRTRFKPELQSCPDCGLQFG